MKEKIALDDVRIESLSEDLKKGFPKIDKLYIAKEHYILVDFVNKDYDIDTLLDLRSLIDKLWPDTKIEILVKDFIDNEILEDLMSDSVCVFDRDKKWF